MHLNSNTEKSRGCQTENECGVGELLAGGIDALVRLSLEICGAQVALVALYGDDGVDFVDFVGCVGLDADGCEREDWFFDGMPERRELLMVSDAAADERFSGKPLVAGGEAIRFFAGAPLVTAEGEVVGALCVMNREPRELSESQQKSLSMLGRLVVMQLEARVRCSDLADSERRLRAIFEHEPECVKLLGLNCELLDMNPAGLRMIEADSLGQVLGKNVLGIILPVYRAEFEELMRRVMDGGDGRLEFEIEGFRGTRRWMETHATPLRDDKGEIISVLGITRDVTGMKRSQAMVEAQRESLELIASGAPLEKSLRHLALFIESQSPGVLCSVLLMDEDSLHLRHGVGPSLPEDFTAAIDGMEIGEKAGACGTAAFRGEVVVVEDVGTDPLCDEIRELPLSHGLKACFSTPIFDVERKVCGTFALYYRQPCAPEESHLRLVEMATSMAAIAIVRHRESEKLLRSHALLEAVIEGSTDVIFVKDLEGRYKYVNLAGAELAGYTIEEILGKTDAELFPEATARLFRKVDAEVLAAGCPIIREQVGEVGGKMRVFSANKAPWRDVDGSVQGVIGLSRDITENKRAEAELHAGENRFRLFMDHSPTAAWVKDEEGRYVYLNRTYEENFGAKLEEWKGKCDKDFWPAETVEIFRKNDIAALAGDHAVEAVEIVENVNGESLHLLVSKFPFSDADGKRYVGGMGLDISQRIKAEKELQRSESNYRSLVESASDGILVSDKEGKLLDVNAAGCAMFGYSHQEMIGMNKVEIISREDSNRVMQEMARLKVGEVMRTEWKTRRKDGTVFPSEVSVTALPDGRGLGIVRDMTERKKLEQQFLRAQRMESIGTLAGGIAHDLNNALAPILMSLDLLKLKFTDSGSQELIGIIDASAKRGAEMVRQVLSFARGVEGEKNEVRLEPLLREVEKFANDTFMKSIVVKLDLAAELETVEGDVTQLHQVLVNLCVNARDAMPEGGRLKLSAENHILDEHYTGVSFGMKPGLYVLIRVEDSGMGMSQEVMDNIFDPFFTTKEFGSGTGLGLSTSQAIIKSHGGFIRVYSEEGRGTRFNVYLPASTAERKAPVEAVPAGLPRGEGEVILIIEDEILVRQVTRDTLEAYGYRVILAADGADGVALYASNKDEISLVITDMMMPVMDGPATIRILQRLNPSVRIIATSGLTSVDHIRQVTELGVSRFLSKPYTAETLLSTIRDALCVV